MLSSFPHWVDINAINMTPRVKAAFICRFHIRVSLILTSNNQSIAMSSWRIHKTYSKTISTGWQFYIYLIKLSSQILILLSLPSHKLQVTERPKLKRIKSVNVQVMKLVSFTAIKSEIKISIEINPLLYNGLIANSDQSTDYYKILSRVVG